MEDNSTFVGREPVGSDSFGSLSTPLKQWYIAIAQALAKLSFMASKDKGVVCIVVGKIFAV